MTSLTSIEHHATQMKKASFYTDYSDSDEDSISRRILADHQLLRDELSGHVIYDDPSVFSRLRVMDEDPSIITRCHDQYQADMGPQLHQLLRLADVEMSVDAEYDAEAKQEHEQRVYGPLTKIFEFLRMWGDNGASAIRHFQQSSPFTMSPLVDAADSYAQAAAKSKYCPDFDLLSDDPNRASWHVCDAFAVIRAAQVENDRPDADDQVDPVIECADYARYHMAFRPFSIFSVALLITGTVFRVMIVDRDGVILSPLHSIGAEIFVRVVRVLTRNLSEVQLGHDPSVEPVSRSELSGYLQRSALAETHPNQVPLAGGDYYPSYRINPFGDVKRTWCTIGPPISVSMSLHGRGTQGWRVLELGTSPTGMAFVGRVHVLKSAWRDSRKVAETEVYDLITRLRLGIARSLYGSDVFYHLDPQTWSPLNIARIRGYASPDDPNFPNPSHKTLHRIVLETLGEPLWGYQDELELLEAFSAIIKAHKFLCEKGIVHRDISPGNALLCRGGPVKGFIINFEIARVDDKLMPNLKNRVGKDPVRKGTNHSSGKPIMTPSSVHTGIDYSSPRPITETIQFRALPLLAALMSGASVEHTASHDLESIAYLLGYTVLRRLVMTPGCPIILDQVLEDCFGQPTVGGILQNRQYQGPLEWIYASEADYDRRGFVKKWTSSIMRGLFQQLRRTLQAHRWQAEDASSPDSDDS
ncbi:hypothetical protein C8Q72DRAFT_984008, partial [Fomitopsis betulina]